MQFKTNKKEFVEAIAISIRAVSSKQNTPILSGIYINANDNTIEFQSTDYELGLIVKIKGDISEEGSVILSGKYLSEVSRKLPGDTVEFTYNASERVAHISSAGSNYRLLSMSGDFPQIETLQNDISINIKSNELLSMIKKTTFSAATDEIRPIFTGCFFDITDDTLTMVATNTHRLALNKMTINNSSNNMRAIIPARALNELLHSAKDDEENEITISHSNNQVSFSFQNIYMITRIIEGEYPDYRRVIPSDSKTTITADKDALASAIDRVSLISRYHEFHTINFNITQNNIHILSNNPDIGKAEEDVAVQTEGDDLSISFNVQYLIDVFKIIECDSVKMYFNSNLSPMKLEEIDNPNFSYVVTPVRNQNV